MSDSAATPYDIFALPAPAQDVDDSDASAPNPGFAAARRELASFGLLSNGANGQLPLCVSENLLGDSSFPAPPESGTFAVNADSSDEELVLAACQGDPRSPIAIWRRYGMQVRSKLLRWIGPHDLDDHVQEVFSRLFEQLPRLRQPSALRSFLIGITLRVACTELRRRRRWRLRLTATGELPELVEQTADDGTGRQALSRFEAILEKLAPNTRRVFVLRYVEKLELVDVAAAMDISLATAKRHLARASMRVFAMVEREPALSDYLKN
jgi:RNA polymerase sigma-70 factor (ECF subfamily)